MIVDVIETAVRWLAAAAGIATLVLILWQGVWRGLHRPRGRTTGAGDKVLRAPVLAVLAVLWIGACVLLWRPIPVGLSVLARIIALVVGLLLAVSGLALYWWGAKTLGEMYAPSSALGVTLNAEHRLVRHGPFALLRHPLYLGLQLAAFAGLLVFRTWTLVFVTANFLGLVVRARREEEALAAEFGEAWEAYARQVPRWIPRRRHPPDRVQDGSGTANLTKRKHPS